MLARRGIMVALLVAMGIGAGAAPIYAQELGKEALKSFPAGTIQVEYSRPATLRKLADYESLRQRYMGPWLKGLEASLKELGIRESDVDELILGWNSLGPNRELYGLATGSFDSTALAERAAQRHIAPVTIGGKTSYCLGAGLETPCVTLLGPSLGAFGTLNSLTEMMDARNGARPSLGSDAEFAKVATGTQTEAPIWGIATNEAVGAWFKRWMPTQNNIQLEWTKVFQNVDMLSYRINAGNNVHLHVKLYCKSPGTAGSLRQVLEGLKLAQQLAWQSRYPNQADPFSGMEVALNGSEVNIQLTANYGDLSAAGTKGEAFE